MVGLVLGFLGFFVLGFLWGYFDFFVCFVWGFGRFVLILVFVEISQQHGLVKERVEARALSDVFVVCEQSY